MYECFCLCETCVHIVTVISLRHVNALLLMSRPRGSAVLEWFRLALWRSQGGPRTWANVFIESHCHYRSLEYGLYRWTGALATRLTVCVRGGVLHAVFRLGLSPHIAQLLRLIFRLLLHATACTASHVLAIIEVSVRPSVWPSVTPCCRMKTVQAMQNHEIFNVTAISNLAFVTKFRAAGLGNSSRTKATKDSSH